MARSFERVVKDIAGHLNTIAKFIESDVGPSIETLDRTEERISRSLSGLKRELEECLPLNQKKIGGAPFTIERTSKDFLVRWEAGSFCGPNWCFYNEVTLCLEQFGGFMGRHTEEAAGTILFAIFNSQEGDEVLPSVTIASRSENIICLVQKNNS